MQWASHRFTSPGSAAMRADGLIESKGTRLIIPDWDRLKEVGEFTPRYLTWSREILPHDPHPSVLRALTRKSLVLDAEQRLLAV